MEKLIFKELFIVYFSMYFLVHYIIFGDIAQLARAPALQAGGQGFDSLYLHHRDLYISLKHIEKYIDK